MFSVEDCFTYEYFYYNIFQKPHDQFNVEKMIILYISDTYHLQSEFIIICIIFSKIKCYSCIYRIKKLVKNWSDRFTHMTFIYLQKFVSNFVNAIIIVILSLTMLTKFQNNVYT